MIYWFPIMKGKDRIGEKRERERERESLCKRFRCLMQ